jgi:hypothetical protein
MFSLRIRAAISSVPFFGGGLVPARRWHRRRGGINPHLFGSATEVLGTLHEAAYAVLNGDPDNGNTHFAGCSLHHRFYHLRVFRDLCTSPAPSETAVMASAIPVGIRAIPVDSALHR